jgi:DNA polymerase III epsilon subunit-like protein
MAIHHITDEMIEDLPIFEKDENYNNLINILKNDIFVAHNTNFDYREVLNGIYNIEIENRICTLKLARRLLPKLPKHSLQYLRYYFKLDFGEKIDPHAALSDVIVLK